MAIKHQIVVEKELKKNKACLGEDLVNVIIKSDLKCSKDNARKIPSRSWLWWEDRMWGNPPCLTRWRVKI